MSKKPEQLKLDIVDADSQPVSDTPATEQSGGFSPDFDDMVTPSGDTVPDEETSAPLAVYTSSPAFNPEDITPPVIKLLQALSPDVVEGSARAGTWGLAGFESQQAIHVVPIQFARRREYRDEEQNILTCISYDGEVGEGDPGGVCADCPMNKWTGEGKNRKGPKCVFMYSYMVYVHEFDTVGVVNFKRTGLAVGRALNSVVSRSGMGRVVVRLSSKLQSGGRGSYYVPAIQPLSAVDSADILKAAKNFLGM